jgi:hypothetical protein
MNEMMIDLETRDTIPSAIIQSIGAVVWKTVEKDFFGAGWRPMPGLDYEVVERYYRKPDTKEQEAEGRTQSIATMKWWAEQDIDAFNEAFSTHDRRPIEEVWRDLLLLAAAHGVTRFWASPCTFDFPILGDFQRMFGLNEIWSYNQMYDVRTVVLESNLSVKNHVPMRPIAGKAHMPVTDCEWQIDLLTAARQKLKRRVG